MNGIVAIDVLLPAVLLGVLGWIVPQLLAKIMPEGLGPLVAIATYSFGILLVLSGLIFMLLYTVRGAMPEDVSLMAALFTFGRAGLLSGLLWLPVLIISVANLPRKWVKEVW